MASINNFSEHIINVKFKPGTKVQEEQFTGNNKFLVADSSDGSLELSGPDSLNEYNPFDYNYPQQHVDIMRIINDKSYRDLFLLTTSDPRDSYNQYRNRAKIYVKSNLMIPEMDDISDSINLDWSVAISDFSNFTGHIGLPFYPVEIREWTPLYYIENTYQEWIPSQEFINQPLYRKIIPFSSDSDLICNSEDSDLIKHISLFIHKQNILEINFSLTKEPEPIDF